MLHTCALSSIRLVSQICSFGVSTVTVVYRYHAPFIRIQANTNLIEEFSTLSPLFS